MGGGPATRGADWPTGLGFSLLLAWMDWMHLVFKPVAAEAFKVCRSLGRISVGLCCRVLIVEISAARINSSQLCGRR